MQAPPIHIFGDLYLPDPKGCLPKAELTEVERLLRSVDAFKRKASTGKNLPAKKHHRRC
jgi:hypothetical protein